MTGAEELGEFCAFCSNVLTTEGGTPLEIEPFQRVILAEFFAGAFETVCLIPKKNGKSSLISAVALWNLLSTKTAEIIIVAAARDQAGILLRQCAGFVNRSQPLRRRLKIRQREIADPQTGGRIRIMASDVDTSDGTIPSMVCVDEFHRHRSAELYSILRDGLGPRHGRMISISTAGSDETSPLGVLRHKAHQMPGLERDGAHTHVSGSAGGPIAIVLALVPAPSPAQIPRALRGNGRVGRGCTHEPSLLARWHLRPAPGKPKRRGQGQGEPEVTVQPELACNHESPWARGTTNQAQERHRLKLERQRRPASAAS